MTIRECIHISQGDPVGRARYLNKLFLQDEREYRAHLIFSMNGYFRVNREKFPIDREFFFVTLPGDHYTVTPEASQQGFTYYLTIFELGKDDQSLADFISSNISGETFTIPLTHRFDFDEIISRVYSDNTFKKQSAHHAFLSILYSLSREQAVDLRHAEGRDIIDEAVRFMQDRKYGDFHLKELSRHLNLSVPHFIRIFKSRMGLPPMKYFTRIRVEEAAGLLMNSDRPLATIAEELDFSSAAHFSKVFKQYMGASPIQYRNNYVNALENRQERSLREIEKAYALLDNIIDESPDLVFYKDINGVLMGCNKAFCEIMGRTKDEIVGRTDYDLFSREQAEFFIRRDEMIYRTNRPSKNDEWMVSPDGRKRKFEVYKAPFHDSKGHILGLIGISRDIHERDA